MSNVYFNRIDILIFLSHNKAVGPSGTKVPGPEKRGGQWRVCEVAARAFSKKNHKVTDIFIVILDFFWDFSSVFYKLRLNFSTRTR